MSGLKVWFLVRVLHLVCIRATDHHLGVKKQIFYDLSYGVLTQLYAGTSPESVDFNGKVRFNFVSGRLSQADHLGHLVSRSMGTYWLAELRDTEGGCRKAVMALAGRAGEGIRA